MADGIGGPDFLTRSMFFREAEQGPTQQDLATMTAPFGGSVEQAHSFLQSPGVQEHLQRMGVHFDPSQIRQSPFLPNAFMQGHPHLGGALSGAMANAAATPEAPMVSGAGSGISRAMHGMYGGPELQRQYQVRQLMAPFQAMGMQMPVMAEERRQQLLQALMGDMQNRQNMGAEEEERKRQADQMRFGQQTERIAATRPFTDAGGHTLNYLSPHAAIPTGGPGGLDFSPQGPGRQIPSPVTGQPTQGPGGWGLAPGVPATEGGWERATQQPTPQEIEDYIKRTHPERQGSANLSNARAGEQTAETAGGMAPAKVDDVKQRGRLSSAKAHEAEGEYNAGKPQAVVNELNSRGDKNRATAQHTLAKLKGETPENYAKFSAQFNKERDAWTARQQHIAELKAAGSSPEAIDEMTRLNDSSFEEAKKTIDNARHVGSGQGASQPWQRPGPVTPGAKPGNTTTSPAPNPYDAPKQPVAPSAPVNPY